MDALQTVPDLFRSNIIVFETNLWLSLMDVHTCLGEHQVLMVLLGYRGSDLRIARRGCGQR